MFSSFHCLFFEWDRHSDYGAQRRFYQLADHRSDTDRYRPSIIFSSFHFSLFSFLPVIRRGFFGRRLDLHNDLVRLRTGVRVTDLSGSASASHQFTSLISEELVKLVSEESSFRRRARFGGELVSEETSSRRRLRSQRTFAYRSVASFVPPFPPSFSSVGGGWHRCAQYGIQSESDTRNRPSH